VQDARRYLDSVNRELREQFMVAVREKQVALY
jgi:hypothetical protein